MGEYESYQRFQGSVATRVSGIESMYWYETEWDTDIRGIWPITSSSAASPRDACVASGVVCCRSSFCHGASWDIPCAPPLLSRPSPGRWPQDELGHLARRGDSKQIY